MKNNRTRGYTLIELIVAVGLFALIMTLVSGAYIMMIGLTERAQNTATGIDNLSFALETMTRTIRTGTDYSSDSVTFSVTDASGIVSVKYLRSTLTSDCGTGANGCLVQIRTNTTTGIITRSTLTDPSVNITALNFALSSGPAIQPYVVITVSGTVSGKTTQSFDIRTSAVQRKINL